MQLAVLDVVFCDVLTLNCNWPAKVLCCGWAGGAESRQTQLGASQRRASRSDHGRRHGEPSQSQIATRRRRNQETVGASRKLFHLLTPRLSSFSCWGPTRKLGDSVSPQQIEIFQRKARRKPPEDSRSLRALRTGRQTLRNAVCVRRVITQKVSN